MPLRLPHIYFLLLGFGSNLAAGILFKIAFSYLERDPPPTWRLTNTRNAAMNDNWRDVFIKTISILFLWERNCSHKNGVGWMSVIFHCHLTGEIGGWQREELYLKVFTGYDCREKKYWSLRVGIDFELLS